MRRYRTKSGTVLTEADLQRLADEAEAGYCTALVETDEYVARCFKPMPCPVHRRTLDDPAALARAARLIRAALARRAAESDE